MPKIDLSELEVWPGRATPLGLEVYDSGVRFTLVSRHATRVWLALFDNADDREPAVEFEFDSAMHRTGDVWSIFVKGLRTGALYMYRIEGPFEPEQGHRYDSSVYLLDPYARIIVGDIPGRTAKCEVFYENPDWHNDRRPKLPLKDLVIYETHVRGMTIDESSGVARPGSYLGLIEKIAYLKDLGVTAVELLPVQEFGEKGLGRWSIPARRELRNYWGYNTIGFFAPAGLYASQGGMGEQFDEFRAMVAALHKAGIEVILDVVFNHTAEGDERGPTLCFRGIDNSIFYLLGEDGKYLNFSGCGNTTNCNHPIVRTFILDCLCYWVTVMHIDGFRFDLASILGRDTKGRVVENAALVEHIAEDPVLRDTKLIAEAWDAGGAYQVGSFGDVRWAEWNGKYRDDIRRYWRGDANMKGAFATRLTGSSDLYQWGGRSPVHSINFITAHDGFSLRDFVSYNDKHNEANGEQNVDGSGHNFSWNCGVEGETNEPEINALRLRMQKNCIATLLLSLGVPMMLGGDEFGRTQQGNNNAYCQDNEISWYDWGLLDRYKGLHRFCREIIRFRRENPALRRDTFFDGQPVTPGGPSDAAWFDEDGEPLDWDTPGGLMACRIDGSQNDGTSLCLTFNPTPFAVEFTVPSGTWAKRVNTGRAEPGDICEPGDAVILTSPATIVMARKSLVVLTETVG